MAYREGNRKSSLQKSFTYAFKGIATSFRERNIIIHYCLAIGVLIAGTFFSLTTVEWLFVVTCIGGMIALEMVNTAIERVVDLATSDFHQLAKEAKDVAAGAVLVYSIYSIIVGCIIFLPKVWKLFLQ